ncbi:MAG: EAL domain-containing protein, partial [Methylococcaceae bacterium]|nr:EAL domain-containing protein [Methylococcaceae bacterium]
MKGDILIVEDEAIIAAQLERLLLGWGCRVVALVATGEEAIDQAHRLKPDLVLMDVRLRGRMNGVEAARVISERDAIPIIFLTAYADDALIEEATATQPYGYLVKPVRERELRATIQITLHRRHLERHLAHLSEVLRAVREINQLIIRERNESTLLEEARKILISTRGYHRVGIGFKHPGADDPQDRAVNSPLDAALLEEDFVGQSLAQHRPIIQLPTPEEGDRATEGDYVSAAAIPMMSEGECHGVLAVHSDRRDIFDADEIRLLEEVANDLAFSMLSMRRERARRRAEEDLRMAATVYDNSDEGIMVCDVNERILSVNRAFSVITGFTREEAKGQTPRILRSGRHDPAFFKGFWDQLQERGSWQGEIWNRRKNGELFLIWLSVNTLRDAEGQIQQYISIFSDITQYKENEQRIHFLAFYDPLTALPNRTLLKDRLERLIILSEKLNMCAAVLFINLDRFKNVNDSLGHPVGDALLIEAAGRIQSQIREGDTLSRIGGDEFVVLLPATEVDGAVQVVGKLLQAFEELFPVAGYELNITPSIGISLFPQNGKTFDSLIQSADVAMSRAKAAGRNTYQFFASEMQAVVYNALRIENALRRAIERDELSLHYQPQVDVDRGEIVAAEALVRWNSAEFGPMLPEQFIGVGEETGLIFSIGEWVLKAAISQIKTWQGKGLKPVPVAVNLSAIQFGQNNLASMIGRYLEQADVEPGLLELELTESIAMQGTGTVLKALDELNRLGVKLSIDDFGTGFSNLSYLKRFHVSKLKIDQSFIRHIESEPENQAIVVATIQLAKSLGIEVIAEGVETQEEVDFLKQNG